MAVNLNALTEVQTVGSNQNMLLFGDNNVATRIDYDKLAEAILNKTRDEIGGVSPISAIATLQGTVYTTVLSATTYSTKAAALAALDEYVTSVGNGRKFVGYISAANANKLGLYNTAHYFDCYANSNNYRLLVARPLNGNGIHSLGKIDGTWAGVWSSTPQWANDSIVKITTSLTSYIDNHPFGMFYVWSTTADYTNVGAPSGNAYHYIITKTNSSAAIILAIRMTNGSTATMYMKQMYNNTWGNWIALAI